MSSRYTADGRRRSAMVHATRSHTCGLCGKVGNWNGFESSHGRAHVRRGEAVELVKWYPMYPPMVSRFFLRPDDERIAKYEAEGFKVIRDA